MKQKNKKLSSLLQIIEVVGGVIVLIGPFIAYFLGLLDFLMELDQGKQFLIIFLGMIVIMFVGFLLFLINYRIINTLSNALQKLINKLSTTKILKTIIKTGDFFTKEEKILWRVDSPKKIAYSGWQILNKHKVGKLIESSGFLIKDFKNKKEHEIFNECLEWLKTDIGGRYKVAEITYSNEVSEDDSRTIIALAMVERILLPVLIEDILPEEELADFSKEKSKSYKELLKCCDIEMSNYVYEALNKLYFFTDFFTMMRDKLYTQKDGEFKEKPIEEGLTFVDALGEGVVYNFPLKFFNIDKTTPIANFKEGNEFKIVCLVKELKAYIELIEDKIKDHPKNLKKESN